MTNTRELKFGDVLTLDGSNWKVVAVGAVEGRSTYVHMVSESKGTTQRNGFRPSQVCGWFRDGELFDRP
jgi:hypothetical protein